MLPFVVRASEVAETEGRYPAPFGEGLSFGRDLGRAAGSRALGAWRERLAPGRRTSFPHAHLREEELVYVLSGAPTLRIVQSDGTSETALAPGDFVAFPAGTGIAHSFVNHSEQDAELLVVGERRPGERTAYPEDPVFEAWRNEHRAHRVWDDVHTPHPDAAWPPVRIETPRVVLRQWTEADTIDAIAAQVANTAHLRPFMTFANTVPTPDEHLARIRQWTQRTWADGDVVLGAHLPDGTFLGATGIHDRVGELGRELGYWVAAESEGKGYVTEWCAALSRLCFEVLKLDRVEVRCDPTNARSAAVAQRLGFRHEVTLPRRVLGVDGKPRDTAIWALYADDAAVADLQKVPVRAIDALGRRLL